MWDGSFLGLCSLGGRPQQEPHFLAQLSPPHEGLSLALIATVLFTILVSALELKFGAAPPDPFARVQGTRD